jgi:hypothetical protein
MNVDPDGRELVTLSIVVGAVIVGALIGAGTSIVVQAVNNHGLENIDWGWKGVAGAAITGAVAGAVTAGGHRQSVAQARGLRLCAFFLLSAGFADARVSSWRLVASMVSTSTRSFGKVVRYSVASTLFGNPSSAYFATAWSFSAHRMSPTGGFSFSSVQCSRA